MTTESQGYTKENKSKLSLVGKTYFQGLIRDQDLSDTMNNKILLVRHLVDLSDQELHAHGFTSGQILKINTAFRALM